MSAELDGPMRLLIEIMKPMLVQEARFKRALAYYGVRPEEIRRYYETEAHQLVRASAPWLTDGEADTILSDGNKPTPGARRFGDFWRSLDFNTTVMDIMKSGSALSSNITDASVQEAEKLYRGAVLLTELKMLQQTAPEDVMRVGTMEADGVAREYILASLGLTG
jgi:hypothetical protein